MKNKRKKRNLRFVADGKARNAMIYISPRVISASEFTEPSGSVVLK